MAKRYDWTANEVYDHYDDRLGELIDPENPAGEVYTSASNATSLRDAKFYVMTDEYNVYKCIDNNNDSLSTVQPVGTGTSAFQTADGYVWKFLFRVETADRIKFLTPDYIPVRKMSGVGIPLYDVNGRIDDIVVTDGGSGYTSPPTVIIHGDGTGAVATAVLSGDSVVDVTIDNAGNGYTFAYIDFESSSGSGAAASVSLGGLDSNTPQQDVESAAVSGTVDRIDIINSGVDYINGDIIVAIEGDGQGAEAVAVSNDNGEIISISVTDPGEGYTYANVVISNNIGIGTGATARAIVGPIFGHGGNAQKELYADKLCISVNLDNDTSDYFYNNDFRQLGIIKNPTAYETTDYFSDLTGTTLHKITVDDITNYSPDDVIYTDSNGKFIVIDTDSGTGTVSLLSTVDIITENSILTNVTKGVSNLTINTLTQPDVDSKTGTILYIDNRTYIIRQSDQVEKIRTILQF
jgi:hypothetical protein